MKEREHAQSRAEGGHAGSGINETETDIGCQAHLPGTLRASTRTLQYKCTCPAHTWLFHAFCPISDLCPCYSLYPCLLKALHSELLSKKSCFSWDNQSRLFLGCWGLESLRLPGPRTAHSQGQTCLHPFPLPTPNSRPDPPEAKT